MIVPASERVADRGHWAPRHFIGTERNDCRICGDHLKGVDSGCRYHVSLTADDICVKVFVYHDLQREGRSMPTLEHSKSNTSLKIEMALQEAR